MADCSGTFVSDSSIVCELTTDLQLVLEHVPQSLYFQMQKPRHIYSRHFQLHTLSLFFSIQLYLQDYALQYNYYDPYYHLRTPDYQSPQPLLTVLIHCIIVFPLQVTIVYHGIPCPVDGSCWNGLLRSPLACTLFYHACYRLDIQNIFLRGYYTPRTTVNHYVKQQKQSDSLLNHYYYVLKPCRKMIWSITREVWAVSAPSEENLVL